MNKRELELCKKALYRVNLEEISYFYSLDFQVPDHTPEFTEKMTALIEKTRKKEASFILMNFKKILIAAIISILLVSSLVGCIFAPQIRDFFIEVFDNGTKYKTNEQNCQHVDVIYNLNYLPEGYEEVDTLIDDYSLMRIFKSDQDATPNNIVFEQVPSGTTVTGVDTEEQGTQIVHVNNIELYYTTSKGHYVLLWKTEEYIFSLICPTSIPWDEVEKIILGIQPIDS